MIPERFRWLRTKCSRLFRRGKQEAALNAELQFHVDQLIAQYRDEGMSEREARLAAQREFGAVSAYREEIRDTWRPPELADLWRSLRFAFARSRAARVHRACHRHARARHRRQHRDVQHNQFASAETAPVSR